MRKTGIEATAYGSAYEGRCVYLGQEWPQYEHNAQWGEPWLTAVVEATTPQGAAEVINMLHGRLRMRRFQAPHSHVWNPYSIVLWAPDANEELLEWAECHRLRQHQGTVALRGGQAIHRGAKEEPFWAGDFRVWHQDVWQPAVRPGAFYYGLVRSCQDAENLLAEYSKVWPAQFRKRPGPQEGRKELLGG